MISQEIPPHHPTESELAESLQFQRALLDAMPIPAVVKNQEGRYTLANAAAEAMLGLPYTDMVGKRLAEVELKFWGAENVHRMEAQCEEALRTGMPQRQIFVREPGDGSGEAEYYLGRVQPYGQTEQGFKGLICTAEDVTETHRMQAQLESLSKALDASESASRAKDSFLALMSHEIRTPMSGMLGLAGLLSHSALPDEQSTVASMLEDSAGALMQILDGILDHSKIEAGKVVLEQAPVDVRELCDLSMGLLAAGARKKNLRLRLSIAHDVAAVVLGDGMRLRQILFNLLSNAIKFTEHGTVSLLVDAVGADEAGQRLRWRVADSGIGIDPERQPQLFEPFVQADTSTTRRFGGSGLGLSICRRLVSQMGGEIALRSEPGHGTEVEVAMTLPVYVGRYEPAPLHGLRAGVTLSDTALADDLAQLLRAAGAQVSFDALDEAGLLFVDESRAGKHSSTPPAVAAPTPRAMAKIIQVSKRPKSAGYQLSKGIAKLSANPLRWRGLVQVCQAVREQAAPANKLPDVPAIPPSREEALHQARLILVAEDHQPHRLLIQRQLAMLGYASDAVSNGEEAWQAARQTSYAMLITDCHMPVMDGYTLAQRIRGAEAEAPLSTSSANRLPIIAVTANTGVSETQRCLDSGMDATLIKPVSLSDLRECLTRWITDRGVSIKES